MTHYKDINVIALVGLTPTAIENKKDTIEFYTKENRRFKMYHYQDCCESVSIESIVGNLEDLIGLPILAVKEEIESQDWPTDLTIPEWKDESFTWTTFTFVNAKGSVRVRWHGSSNGYYSESVSFGELTEGDRWS